jgi:hypothetical protein
MLRQFVYCHRDPAGLLFEIGLLSD